MPSGEDHLNELWERQLQLISDYLERSEEPKNHVFLTLPSDIVSTRYISLPVKNKRTAMSMLPFLIEEDLPYSLNECHWAETLITENKQTHATVAVVKKENFESFYNIILKHGLKPEVLTSDVSSLANIVSSNKDLFPESFCIIDLGHHATRGYFFFDNKLVANHNAYVAGATITDAISKTYGIKTEEAETYKHQNSFILLEDQYDNVDGDQKEFSRLMDNTLKPLINEIRRWDIGHRVNHGIRASKIYICGGSANIKNFDNYLEEQIGIPVDYFNPYQIVDDHFIEGDKKYRNRFSQIVALTTNVGKKSRMINFLKDKYALSQDFDLPLDTVSFIAVRMAILTIIFSVFLVAEIILTNIQVSNAKKMASNLFQNPNLDMSKQYKRKIRAATIQQAVLQRIQRKLDTKIKLVNQEVKIIQSSLEINALSELVDLFDIIESKEVELTKFIVSEDKQIDFAVKAEKLEQLEKIKAQLESDGHWLIEIDQKNKTLLAGKGQK